MAIINSAAHHSRAPHLSVTAVVLTKNEADQIANCLETLRWCDDILVIDNDSDDDTLGIASRLGARVFQTSETSFAVRRNLALTKIKTDWIFYIDADERVTPRLYQEIAVHLETKDAQAIRFLRRNICYGFPWAHGGW